MVVDTSSYVFLRFPTTYLDSSPLGVRQMSRNDLPYHVVKLLSSTLTLPGLPHKGSGERVRHTTRVLSMNKSQTA